MIVNHYYAETFRDECESRLHLFLLKRAQAEAIDEAPESRIVFVNRNIRQACRQVIKFFTLTMRKMRCWPHQQKRTSARKAETQMV